MTAHFSTRLLQIRLSPATKHSKTITFVHRIKKNICSSDRQTEWLSLKWLSFGNEACIANVEFEISFDEMVNIEPISTNCYSSKLFIALVNACTSSVSISMWKWSLSSALLTKWLLCIYTDEYAVCARQSVSSNWFEHWTEFNGQIETIAERVRCKNVHI